MMRLRATKWRACGCNPKGWSDMRSPSVPIFLARSAFSAGYKTSTPPRDHGDGPRRESAAVRRSINAAGQSGHDRKSRLAEVLGKFAGHASAKGGRVARANQCNQWAVQDGRRTGHPQHNGGVIDLGKVVWKIRIAFKYKAGFGRVCGVEFSVQHSHGANFVIRHSGCAGDVGQCVQSGTCGSVFAKQSPIRGRANAAGSQQTKSGNPFVFRGGSGG